MSSSSVTVGRAKIDYFYLGDKPRFLITGGAHGDEPSIFSSIGKAFDKYANQLTDFLYIPRISPSAVEQGTRTNREGVDVNRAFFVGTKCEEALAVQEILKNKVFDLHIDFHEDEWVKAFYIYDCREGNDKQANDIISILSEVSALGVDLWEGIDDLDNPNLGNLVKDGYCCPDNAKYDPSIDGWTRSMEITKRSVVPEVPGKLSQEIKDKIVEIIFKNLLL